jgi:hypothetical protein
MDLYVVETRCLRVAKAQEHFLACEYVFFASTIAKAEAWMLDQNPADDDQYYYVVVKVPVDSDEAFILIGYYNMLGEKTTQDRALEILVS